MELRAHRFVRASVRRPEARREVPRTGAERAVASRLAQSARLDAPADTLSVLLPVLAKLRAVPEVSATADSWCRLEGDVPAAQLNELRQQLSPLTRGEGVLETSFGHYQPVRGPAPSRPRTDDNPLNREEYLYRVTRRGVG